jgi:hypothetical protein
VGIAIGFDAPERGERGRDALHLMAAIYEILSDRGLTAHELVAVDLQSTPGAIELLTRPTLRPDYPDLLAILGQLGQTCLEHAIPAHRLQRIAFLDREIGLEMVDGNGDPEVYVFPIAAAAWQHPEDTLLPLPRVSCHPRLRPKSY